MAKAKIERKPDKTVMSLGAPKRGSNDHKMTATWKVPSSMVKDSSKSRATELDIVWEIGLPGKDPKKVIETDNEKKTTSTINLNNFKVGKKTYSRDSFYPQKNKKTLTHVSVMVRGTNAKGKGKWAKAKRKFEKPRRPTISAPSFDTNTGRVSFTIKTNAGKDYRERYDTEYTVKVKGASGEEWTHINATTKDTSRTTGYDVSDYQKLSYNEYVKVTVSAKARGYAGDSTITTRSYYVGYPKKVIIDSVTVDNQGKCTVAIDTGRTEDRKTHPIDQVKLEYLANVEYANAKSIPGDASWTQTDVVDNANCKALAIAATDLMPDKGKHTWVRVKSWHANEAVLYRYSEAVEVTDLYVSEPTAADEDIDIISAMPSGSGDAIIVQLGWNANGMDDSTGTELTWAEDEEAWKSTEEPDLYQFTWSDGVVIVGETTYQDSATITIKGLDEATQYYIRARRYLESENNVTFSGYATYKPVLTSETPESIVATCDRYVPSGASLNVRWTLSGGGLQQNWAITKVIKSGDDWVNSTEITSGTGRLGATQIEASRLAELADNGTLNFTVSASTGGDPVVSDRCTVTIQDPPTVSVTVPEILTEQPCAFNVTASAPANLTVIVTSQGITGEKPEGTRRQTEGDTIYSDLITPEWEEVGDTWTATITLPTGLEFWDLGTYTLDVTAMDTSSGLYSTPSISEFSVLWANQAVDPEDAITLTEINETVVDSEGNENHIQAVRIALTAPTGSYEGDVYDIYRVCGEEIQLIGESFPLTYTATDYYAPFGTADLAYRVAIRTADGDAEFAEIEYNLAGDSLRFDWDGNVLELPYNIEAGDTYKKDVQIRNHMDGSTDGYWNRNIERTGSFSADMIRLEQQEDIIKVRQLARYAGAVFVRTPDGSAYAADVQLTDLSKANPKITAIAIDTKQIGLTEEFMLSTPYLLDTEEEG